MTEDVSDEATTSVSSSVQDDQPAESAPRGYLRSNAASRKVRVVLGVVLAVLLVAGTVAYIRTAREVPEDAVLQMGDLTITKDQYERRVAVLTALYGLKKPEGGPSADRFRRDAAKSIAVSAILDRAAQRRNIVIADRVAEDALGKFIDAQLTDGEQGFVRFLGANGLSRADVLDEVKRQLSTVRLFASVTKKVKPPTTAQVESAFRGRQQSMVSAERRHLRNIVVRSEADAHQVLGLLKGGADFGATAAEYSLDVSTSKAGGDLGLVSADQLDAAFAKASFAARDGGLFGPVRSKFGWNVGQVAGIEPGTPLRLEQVRADLKVVLENEWQLRAWRTWLADQIRSAGVRYADNYRPAHPHAAPSSLPTTSRAAERVQKP